MIYPTRTAVIATAAGAPLALAFAAAEPGRWFLALAWPLAIVLLCAFDALRGAASATARVDFPGHAYVGETRDCTVTVSVSCTRVSPWHSLHGSRNACPEPSHRGQVEMFTNWPSSDCWTRRT